MFKIIKLRTIIILLILTIVASCSLYFAVLVYYKPSDLDLIYTYSGQNGVDPILVCAMIHAESKFDKYAVSNKDAKGYMQLMEQTATWGAKELNITDFNYNEVYDVETNIQLGTWYIAKLIEQYGNVDTALAAYNAGSGNVSTWLKDDKYSKDGVTLYNIPYEETENYVNRVNFNMKIYKMIL